jgi:hypothetical protein
MSVAVELKRMGLSLTAGDHLGGISGLTLPVVHLQTAPLTRSGQGRGRLVREQELRTESGS